MKLLLSAVAALLAVALLTGLLAAQIDSGPKAGSKVEALKVAVATGDDAGKEMDFAATRKDKPTVFVFVQADKWDRPMARFLRTLDQELAKDRDDVQVVAVWLTDDVDKSKEYLPRAQESLQFTQTALTVHPGEKSGPAGWGINGDAHATVVVAEGPKVTASLGFRSINEDDVPKVIRRLKPRK